MRANTPESIASVHSPRAKAGEVSSSGPGREAGVSCICAANSGGSWGPAVHIPFSRTITVIGPGNDFAVALLDGIKIQVGYFYQFLARYLLPRRKGLGIRCRRYCHGASKTLTHHRVRNDRFSFRNLLILYLQAHRQENGFGFTIPDGFTIVSFRLDHPDEGDLPVLRVGNIEFIISQSNRIRPDSF